MIGVNTTAYFSIITFYLPFAKKLDYPLSRLYPFLVNVLGAGVVTLALTRPAQETKVPCKMLAIRIGILKVVGTGTAETRVLTPRKLW